MMASSLPVRDERIRCGFVCVSIVINTQQADRLATLTKLEDVTSRRQQLSAELEKYKNCGPERLKEIRKWIM